MSRIDSHDSEPKMTTTRHGDQCDWARRLSSDGMEREKAVAELTDILIRGLAKSLHSHYGGGIQAEDVVQDAMLKILDSLDSFAGRCQFTTWAMTIATRVGISKLRRKHYQDVSLDSVISQGNLSFDISVDPSASAGDQFDRKRVLCLLAELIESELTDKQREAVQATLSGLPIEEIARLTGSNRNAVYKLEHDARLRLKAGFERAGLIGDDIIAILS